ncbi:MAG: alpha/beta fold hydrolase [Chloroflexi bacterium]|nr:alpha/beta fold hydrolase [Chloroflexota bacterium]
MQSHFVQTRDLRMHYLQQGAGDPVIFIHGFPETSYEWRHQFSALAGDYACFAPDTRGFGQTEKPGLRVTRQILAQDIVNFMDALGIEKAAVVAHDWGGIIAFKLAIDWPERVTRLALLDTLCTVWSPGGVHGYWFKAAPYPEEFFAAHHREFIDTIFTGDSDPQLPSRPQSPWQVRSGSLQRWATDEDVEHYRKAFADPMSHFHAISYYRYGLPFHVVHDDSTASHGERFQFLSEAQVAEMWTHPEGLEQHPLYTNFMDYGPEDRHKRFPNPALWMFGNYLSRNRGTSDSASDPGWIPSGNPFADQFSRYFPDLRARRVDAGHFFPEEAPRVTNNTLEAFLGGSI